MTWKRAFASMIGTSHRVSGTPCQDASACFVIENDSEAVLACIASDGAGSARLAHEGAKTVCNIITQRLLELFKSGEGIERIDDRYAEETIEFLHSELDSLAESLGASRRELACTLLVAVVGAKQSAYLQIGDGAIVVSPREEPDEFSWIFWPDKGEYANQTNFVTDPAAKTLMRFEINSIQAIDEVCVLTDGMESLALDFVGQEAFQEFFRPLFATLRASAGEMPENLSKELGQFLDTPAVNDRTDDDKTLIIASRRVDTRFCGDTE